jgi:hypothetical protein
MGWALKKVKKLLWKVLGMPMNCGCESSGGGGILRGRGDLDCYNGPGWWFDDGGVAGAHEVRA